MANTKKIASFIVLFILFILFQAPVGFAQEGSFSYDESKIPASKASLFESEAAYPGSADEEAITSPEETATEKSSSEKSKDETEKQPLNRL